MKSVIYTALAIAGTALNLPVLVPESVEEFDLLAKKPGAALDEAIANVIYRGFLAEFRGEFVSDLEDVLIKEFPEHAELKRKTIKTGKTKKLADGTEEEVLKYDEAELEYVRRALGVLATLRNVPVVEISAFQSLADAVLAKTEEVDDGNGGKITVPLIRFNPLRNEPKERGPKVVPKMYIKAAEGIIAAGKVEAFFTKQGIELPVFTEDVSEADRLARITDTIARKIQALEDAERAKQDLQNKYA